MKNTQKGLGPVVIVVILAVLLGGGYVAYRVNNPLPSFDDGRDLEKEAEEFQESQTADWKTYRNDKYGFEFQYPSHYGPPQAVTPYARPKDMYLEKAGDTWVTKYRDSVSSLQAVSLLSPGPNLYPLLRIQVFKLSDYRFVSLPGGTEYGFDAQHDSWWQDFGQGRSPVVFSTILVDGLRGYKLRDGDAGEVYDAILFPNTDKNILVEIGGNWNSETKHPLPPEDIATTFKFTK